MSKMSVQELANQLEKSTKEILKLLEKMNVEGKDVHYELSDNEVGKIKAFYERRKQREERGELPERKKKKVIQVFNPQNSRISGGPDKRLKEIDERQKEEVRAKEAAAEAKAAAEEAAKRAAEAKAAEAKAAEEAAKEAEKKAAEEAAKAAEKKAAQEAKKTEEKKAEEKPKKETEKTEETNTDNRSRRESDSRPRREGDSRPRREGDTRPRREGDSRPRREGDSRPRREGDSRPRREGDNRPRREGDNRPRRDGQGAPGRDNNRGGFNTNRGGSDGRQNRGAQNGRGSRDRVVLEQPAEAIERQNQKNKRSEQRNEKKNYEKKNYEKRAPRSLEKQTRKPVKPQQKQEPKEDVVRTITLPEIMTIKELADKMKVQPSVIVKKLFMQGEIVTVNHEIDFEKAEEIALEYNCIAEAEVKVDVIAELLKEEEEAEETMITRAPVVCVMGHVDHGKTSLLDAIRHTRVTDREAGGITQHIGAYMVKCNGQDITFLDTPGHEAFTAMRMRGANSTDIAILVVAADDGVMPQTVEAINHAKAAGIEIIVAINKIDKPSANVDRVKQELSEYELIPEDWGGSTIFVPVSAHTKEGIDELLEMILLTAEVLELKANPNRQARGLVIEAELDKGKGPVATVLVQKGTLRVGDFIAAGACHGKVRAMMDDQGRRVKSAGPSTPVEILGFNGVPHAGEIFVAPETDKEAKNFAETFVAEGKERKLEETRKTRMSLDDLFSQIQAGNVKELNLIVKADVQGSVEAVKNSLVKLSNEEVMVKVIHGGVGAVTESDVALASASNAIIIGFNVRADVTAKVVAEQEGVDVRFYKVIYNAIEDVEAAMKGMLDPVYEEKVIGHAEVRQIFKASGVGTIAGSYVLDGVFKRGCSVRVTREGAEVYTGPLTSLKRFKDDVKEVRTNFECGLVMEGFPGVQELDIIEAYEMVEVPR